MFLKNPETAHTREKLFFAVWGSGYMGDSRTLDMHIKTLRRKLKEYGKCKMVSVEYIHSWCANSIEVKTDLAVGVA